MSVLENSDIRQNQKGDQPTLQLFNCEKAPEVYQCKHCDFRTDFLTFLRKHSKQVHLTVQSKKSPVEYSLKSYICNSCIFETYSVLLLHEHKRKCSPKIVNNEETDGSAAFSKDSEKIVKGLEGDKCIVTESQINSVQYLLKHLVPLDQKRLIYEKGRPIPDIEIKYRAISYGRTYYRGFNKTVYDKYEWMCGCPVTNKLFCFVCLLFKRKASIWTTHGVRDVVHLAEIARKHEHSIHHLNSWMDYNLLGKINIGEHVNTVELQNKLKHNEKVEKHRDILRKLITCIKFCGAFEIAADNPGFINFADELNFLLKNAPEFKGTSRTIKNELLDAMLEVYRNELIKQIKSANFVALEADETTDSCNKRKIIIIIRYVHNGEICERFWSCVKLNGYTADHLAGALLSELQDILEIPSDKFKLIAQSYDGSSIMTGRKDSVQAIIRKSFPQAYFVHCYAHEFNFIMEQAVRSHKKLKLFFGNLQSFISFFSQSSRCQAVFDEVRLTDDLPIGWDFKTRTVNTLFEYRNTFRQYLETITDAEGLDCKTLSEACELLNHLKCPEFLYWLKLFNFIMPHVEMLFTQAQSHGLEKVQLENAVDQFEQQIVCIRSITANIDLDDQEDSNRKTQESPSAGFTRSAIAKEVCDNILTQIKDRFHFKDYLSAAKLFDSKEFKTYRDTFPKKYFDETVKSYRMLNNAKLKTELTAIYEHDDMCAVYDLFPFLFFLADNNLKNIFSETYKLLDIICTTPSTTSECERCFSTLTNIKTFLRSTVTDARLNALAVLSTEKKFLQSIPDFDDKVVEVFCNTKGRKNDFLYK